jgi:NitT/TauT family transport system ATP-binding protein
VTEPRPVSSPAQRTRDDAGRRPGEPPIAEAAGSGTLEISVAHAFGELTVIERLDLRAAPGQVVGLVGPSGCGKTTLLELVAGLLQPSRGSIAIGSAAKPAERLARCAYMPQRDLLLPWLSAVDNAAIALRNRGASRGEARRAAAPLFERFGLAGFEGSRPAELSGGMRQRVAFLRTLMAGKPVLLLDEPFGALDAITRAEMQEWLAGALAAEPRTVLLVSHDVEEALYLCDRVLVLGPRPTRTLEELAFGAPRSAPRARVVSDAGFAALRERALVALAAGRS